MIQLEAPVFLNVEFSRSFVKEYPICAAEKNIVMPYPTTDPEVLRGNHHFFNSSATLSLQVIKFSDLHMMVSLLEASIIEISLICLLFLRYFEIFYSVPLFRWLKFDLLHHLIYQSYPPSCQNKHHTDGRIRLLFYQGGRHGSCEEVRNALTRVMSDSHIAAERGSGRRCDKCGRLLEGIVNY